MPLSNLAGKRILLASHSPRRRELIAMLCIDFSIADPIEVDESYPADMPADTVAEYISKKKAEAYAATLTADTILITADTIVLVDGEILGKPHSEASAKEMLRKLSGKSHKVITGVTLSTVDTIQSFSAVTTVNFDNLSDKEIEYYIENYHPFDKAGAYGIQEWIGAAGIKGIEGSYYLSLIHCSDTTRLTRMADGLV
ncbi:MAG: Maf family nucleotide pyrophosphatase [Muribaculum sp.]|nr:Maf family nucleotide pyrophosphatase [Muribaculum sp.]